MPTWDPRWLLGPVERSKGSECFFFLHQSVLREKQNFKEKKREEKKSERTIDGPVKRTSERAGISVACDQRAFHPFLTSSRCSTWQIERGVQCIELGYEVHVGGSSVMTFESTENDKKSHERAQHLHNQESWLCSRHLVPGNALFVHT